VEGVRMRSSQAAATHGSRVAQIAIVAFSAREERDAALQQVGPAVALLYPASVRLCMKPCSPPKSSSAQPSKV
jgi:hypothetical protein